jgi:single-stranded DNA-binding protein
VSVVARLVSDREIRVTQANWVHHRITHEEPVVDVSESNDWSQVRVWWAPSNTLGTSVYPTYGFIVSNHPRDRGGLVAGLATP